MIDLNINIITKFQRLDYWNSNDIINREEHLFKKVSKGTGIAVLLISYRDDLILELEKRIFNNIKTEYNEELFDNDLYFGGYYQNAEWKYNEYTPLVSKDF